MTEEHLNTEGVAQVGEIETRAMRETRTEADYHNATVAGAVMVLEATAMFIRGQIQALGRYDDPRQLQTTLVWIADKIREVQQPKEDPRATT